MSSILLSVSGTDTDDERVAFYMKMPETLYNRLKRVSELTMIPMSEICRTGISKQVETIVEEKDIDIEKELK